MYNKCHEIYMVYIWFFDDSKRILVEILFDIDKFL